MKYAEQRHALRWAGSWRFELFTIFYAYLLFTKAHFACPLVMAGYVSPMNYGKNTTI